MSGAQEAGEAELSVHPEHLGRCTFPPQAASPVEEVPSAAPSRALSAWLGRGLSGRTSACFCPGLGHSAISNRKRPQTMTSALPGRTALWEFALTALIASGSQR